ncbi:MAG: YicC family protein [Bacteroidetes bacterium GWE2_29_8]|nr:MAG: YicC family protein [Bacteroidetes bacterium GWE2_29_8]OFY19148.1 MAG: YicC family protein [Bacteroidetes bacterium GWF2_29_10]
MIKSMTGFGNTLFSYKEMSISIEIKTLNSKQFDCNIRVPMFLKSKEFEIRSLLQNKIERGKVDMFINANNINSLNKIETNTELAYNYYKSIESLSQKIHQKLPIDIISTIIKLPDVLTITPFELENELWNIINNNIIETIDICEKYRMDEGLNILHDFLKRIDLIEQKLKIIKELDKDRVIKIKNRISKSIENEIGLDKIDKNRFEQEVIYYLEKLDITEEQTRLKNHLKFFYQTINSENSEGRKLAFITQEIGREINTIGSKANDFNIQKIIVEMKDELEKIKEQLANIF